MATFSQLFSEAGNRPDVQFNAVRGGVQTNGERRFFGLLMR
jgi:hypothetical protein